MLALPETSRFDCQVAQQFRALAAKERDLTDPSSRPFVHAGAHRGPLHVDDRIECRYRLGGDRRITHPRERAESMKPRRHIIGSVRMDRGPASVVPRIQSEQKIAHFRASTLAKYQSVGSHAHRGAHEFRQGDSSSSLHIRFPFDEGNDMRVIGGELGDLLNADDSLVGWNQAEQGCEQCRLPASRRP